MQLRTFVAKDMQAALKTMRAVMGPKAVIVASEKTKGGGVIVRAAIEPHQEQPQPPAIVAMSDFKIHRKDTSLRRTKRTSAVMTQDFDRINLLTALGRHRVPEQLAHELTETAAKSKITDMILALAAAIERRTRLSAIDFGTAGALLLTGPNGAGKTAVAAKLGAHARLAGRRTTLIAADAVGAGAVERLAAFAKHLDAALAIVDSAPELSRLVGECLSKGTFVVIDTAGFDPRRAKSHSAYAALGQIPGIETLGVVSATTDALELCEITSALGGLGAKRLVITGLDLVHRLGALLCATTQSLPIAHVSRSAFVAGGLELMTPLMLARQLLDEHRSRR